MLAEILQHKNLILASKSPRRQELLKGLHIDFEVKTMDVKETYPPHLQGAEVARYLSELKATAFTGITPNDIVLTSDTTVCLNGEILNKPADREDAFRMLRSLSGKSHEVVTGVCLRTADQMKSFTVSTTVYFKALSEEEIEFYVDTYQPMDKAGAYGIQEWIGYIGIEKIEGSYFNVMGLPLKAVYDALLEMA